VKLVGDLVMSVLSGLAVAAGLGAPLGWSGTLAWPAGPAGVIGLVAGVGLFVWRRQDPEAHESPRERLERQLFGR
jgi:hypothetical protein